MTEPWVAEEPATVTTMTANGLFGPGIFGSGIDLSALDEGTAYRLGGFMAEQIQAAHAAGYADGQAAAGEPLEPVQHAGVDELEVVLRAMVLGPGDRLVVAFPAAHDAQEQDRIMAIIRERGFADRVLVVFGAEQLAVLRAEVGE